jgi:CRP-like cAMP-binding protein
MITKMLLGHHLFKSLLPEQVEAVSRFSHTKCVEKGENLYRPDGKATHVFILMEGQVELRLPHSADRTGLLVSRVRKDEVFGIAPLLGSDQYTTTAHCTEASRILFIEAQPLMDLLKENPLVGQQIMRAVARAYFDRYMLLMKHIQSMLTHLAVEE